MNVSHYHPISVFFRRVFFLFYSLMIDVPNNQVNIEFIASRYTDRTITIIFLIIHEIIRK